MKENYFSSQQVNDPFGIVQMNEMKSLDVDTTVQEKIADHSEHPPPPPRPKLKLGKGIAAAAIWCERASVDVGVVLERETCNFSETRGEWGGNMVFRQKHEPIHPKRIK